MKKVFDGLLSFVIRHRKMVRYRKYLHQYENKNYPIYFLITTCSSFTYGLMNYVSAAIDILFHCSAGILEKSMGARN
jgi:hypothetical protein